MATTTSLGFSIFSTYSGTGVTAARRDLASLNSDLDKSKNKLGAATTSLFSLSTAAAALGPAIVPVGSAVLGVGVATATMATAAGAALGAYGFVMKNAITDTLKLAKAHKDLSPVQQTFINNVNQMKSAMNGVSTGTMNLTLMTATTVVQGLTSVIRGMTPVIKAVAPAVDQVANAFKNWAAGDGLQRFVDIVIKDGVPALKNLLDAGRSVLGFLGDGFRALAPTIVPMSKAIADGAANLKKWADNGGFADFLTMVRNNGSSVREFFDALAAALLQVGKAMAGLGPLSLSLTLILLRLVAALPVPVIQAIVIAIVAWRLAMVAMAIQAVLAAAANIILADSLIVTTSMVVAMELSLVLLVVAIAAIGIGIYYLVTNWNTVWNAIKTTAQTVWTFLTTGLGQLVLLLLGIPGALIFIYANWNTIWNGMKTAAQAVWNALQVAWAAFIGAMNTTWLAVSGALVASWNAVWNAMRAAAQAVWSALGAAWAAFFAGMSAVFATFNSGMRTAWSNLWNAVKSAAETIWNGIKTAFSAFFSGLSSVFATFNSGMRTAWSNLWNAIKTTASTVWSAIDGGFKSFASGVESTLSGLVSKAGSIWNGIVSVFKAPINGVISIWNTVADVFGLKKISALASGGVAGVDGVGAGASGGGTTAFASGGHVRGPGGPTDDKVPAMLSAGEFVVKAAAVDHYGVDNLYALNAMKLAGGGAVGDATAAGPIPAMALGGIIPSPGDIIGDIGNVIGAVGGVITSAALSGLKSLIGDAFMSAVTPLMDALAPPDSNPPGGVLGIPHAAYKMAEKAILELLKTSSNIGGVIPAGDHLAIIDAALKAAGVPPPGSQAEWEAGLNTLITRESNWDSGAINNTDSNAAAGTPSEGLAQTIGPTFNAYHVAGTSSNILDPVANVAAAIRYIVAVYGNITNVQQANANLPPKGYRRGTDNASKGWHMIDEDGGEWINFRGGEKVLPHGRKPSSGTGGSPVVVNVSHTWNGNPTQEAVQYAEGDMCDSIRQAVHAGVGGRAH